MPELRNLLELMFHLKASDLILTAGAPPMLRVSGEIKSVKYQSILKNEEIEKLLFSMLNDTQIERFKREKELDASFGIEGISRFRLNAYYQRGSTGVAIRLIPFDIPKIEDLGLPPVIKKFADKPNGLILVTGPTGSGKSTTLSSIIEYINEKRRCHIITIEDPIEFIHGHKKSVIDQREVGSDTISFHEALRHVLRETPDVIMIGEMRDLDTIKAALTLAETGHLILATLHTHSAPHAVSRIIDVFPAEQQQQVRVQLSAVLVGVVVQELISRKDKDTLILAPEIMNVTNAIKHLIRENSIHQIYSTIQTGSEHGMITLNGSLYKLVKENLIDEEIALQRSNDPKELSTLLKQKDR
ncbi:MAG: type IV pilus twitching motility protein PilT [Candidatus Omnitrophica bacterium]|nr:type IV pilus twitching motility protein PilT [Candidatus Omnitrophota bacterium]